MPKIDFSKLHNAQAEQMTLSSVFIEPHCIYELATVLRPEMFYGQQRRGIYASLLEMAEGDTPIDIATVVEYLRKQGKLDKVGGVAAVTSIAGLSPTAANVLHYAGIVRDYYRRRELVAIGDELCDAAQNADSVEDKLADFQNRLASVAAGDTNNTVRPMRDTCMQILKWMDERSTGEFTGILSGIAPIDILLRGWQKTELIIIAARPSMGKTALSQTFAVNAAMRGKSVLFFSLEMGLEELGGRITAMVSRLPTEKIFAPNTLTEDEWDRLLTVNEKMAKWPLFIDDKSSQTPLQMLSKARQVQGKYGLDLIIVDYLQIVRGNGKENRTQEISYISAALKGMAKELNVPVIALSQLSREVEKRNDKRPMMSDLRDGGSIEQDADVVVTLYREKYYRPELEDDITEFNIVKNRNGKLKCINLRFVAETMSFESAVE